MDSCMMGVHDWNDYNCSSSHALVPYLICNSAIYLLQMWVQRIMRPAAINKDIVSSNYRCALTDTFFFRGSIIAEPRKGFVVILGYVRRRLEGVRPHTLRHGPLPVCRVQSIKTAVQGPDVVVGAVSCTPSSLQFNPSFYCCCKCNKNQGGATQRDEPVQFLGHL